MEDNLKILEYPSKQIVGAPPMEDNLEILKVEYLSNHWSKLG